MDKEIRFGIFLVLILLVLLIINQAFINQKRAKCNALGGIYIESQCIKADLIKLN